MNHEPRQTCSPWATHYCYPGNVYFILRTRPDNDYCIGGKRVILRDDGILHSLYELSPQEIQLLETHLLDKYAEFLKWHAQHKEQYGLGNPESFEWKFPLIYLYGEDREKQEAGQ